MSSGAGPKKVLVTLGYSGWGAGQLEDEIGRNGWLDGRRRRPRSSSTRRSSKRYDAALVAAGHRPAHAHAGGGARMSRICDRACAASPVVPGLRFRHPRVGVAAGNTLLRRAQAADDRRRRGRRALRGDRSADRGMAARRAGGRRALPPRRRGARQHARARSASRASCRAASGCRCTRSTSATRPPKRWPPARADVDAAAAALILEQFLRQLPEDVAQDEATMLQLDAEALYAELLPGVRALLRPESVLVGIWSGGAWLAERLQRDLQPARRARRHLEHPAPRRLRRSAAWPPAPTPRSCRSTSKAATSC